MSFAKGTFCTALVLFGGGALGLLGSWSLVTGAVVLLVSACTGAVALEARDYDAHRSFEYLTATPEPDATVELPAIPNAA